MIRFNDVYLNINKNENVFDYYGWKKAKSENKYSDKDIKRAEGLIEFIEALKPLVDNDNSIVLKNRKIQKLLVSKIYYNSSDWIRPASLIHSSSQKYLYHGVRYHWKHEKYDDFWDILLHKLYRKRSFKRVWRLYRRALRSLPQKGKEMQVLMKLT